MRISQPLTDQDVANASLIKPGVYPFEVLEGVDTQSKAGNEMIRLNLQLYMPDGRTRRMYDYLLESNGRKLRNAAKVCGLIERYESGALDGRDFVGKQGYVKIVIQQSKNPEFPNDSNSVSDYVKDGVGNATDSVRRVDGPSWESKPSKDLDDAIPF